MSTIMRLQNTRVLHVAFASIRGLGLRYSAQNLYFQRPTNFFQARSKLQFSTTVRRGNDAHTDDEKASAQQGAKSHDREDKRSEEPVIWTELGFSRMTYIVILVTVGYSVRDIYLGIEQRLHRGEIERKQLERKVQNLIEEYGKRPQQLEKSPASSRSWFWR
jgi:hypothetical protein